MGIKRSKTMAKSATSETPQEEETKIPCFDVEKFSRNHDQRQPDYEDYMNIKNYKNLTWSDKVAYYKFKFMDGDMPYYLKKGILAIPRRVYVNCDLPEDMLTETKSGKSPKRQYPRNKIRTTKYTPITFIPKNLFFQFQNAANGYFLFIVILGAFQIFGVVNPGLNAVPLIVIVFLTALRDAFEDSRRAISDNELNNSKIHLITGLKNPNVQLDQVGLWRKTKKAMTKYQKKLVFDIIIPFFKKMFTKRSKSNNKNNEIANNRESLDTVNSYTPGDMPRLSVSTTRYLNGSNKLSQVADNTISNPDPTFVPSGLVKFRNKCWKDVYVGDIVRVRQDEEIPSDMIILSTNNEEQSCFIETKNLDGETNLKTKNALKCGKNLSYGNDMERIKCWVECDAPNPNLYSFKGAIHYPKYESGNTDICDNVESVTINNVLFRGSTLRNTKWVIGLVIYTGDETKIMLNSGVTPTKKSRISNELNLSVYINFVFLFLLCLVAGIVNGCFYNVKDNSRRFYEFKPYSSKASTSGVVAFFVALNLYQSLVPISLYVSVEIIKTIQAFFIYSDLNMYYEELDYPCIPKSWNISDDLGQIEYIFSDKTGTLTQNKMEFKKCSIGMNDYGMCYTEAKMGMQKRLGIDVVAEKSKMTTIIENDKAEMTRLLKENVDTFFRNEYLKHSDEEEFDFVSSKYVKEVLDSNNKQKYLNEWFMTCLSLCHTVVSEEDPENPYKRILKAESPDEHALVGVAREMGIEFSHKLHDTLYIERYGEEIAYKMLNVIPFNSTRKRMSVIVEVPKNQLPEYAHEKSDETAIVLISKGADNIIFGRLKRDSDEELISKTALHLEQFSKEGLRTLCVGYKVVDKNYYTKWNDRFHEANASIKEDRELLIDSISDEIEQDLSLVGTTAIEDKLQDGVPNSIALLAKAGIKLWVLTGDKIETAINIGFSCNLLGAEMKLLVMDNADHNKTPEENYGQVNDMVDQLLKDEFGLEIPKDNEDDFVDNLIAEAKENHDSPLGTHAVIVSGADLTVIFEELHETLQKKFLLLCKQCKSILCCRVSPAQKSQVVRVVKDNLDVMTLAIGDGANDVAMIQAANIGVGIAGKEGRQAVMSSDYGLGQFRFLTRLVLVHGKWSYKRLSEMIPCFFYKNVVFTLTLFWYGIYVNFDGTYLFEFTLIMFYNFAFTSLPIIFLAVLDQDVSDSVSLLIPQLYMSGILRQEWSQYKFMYYMLDGLYQSLMSFYFPYLVYYLGNFVTENGLLLHHRFWMGTMVAFIACISCNIYILLQQKRWDVVSLCIYAFSILIVFFWVGVWSASTYAGEYYKAAPQVFGSASFWAVFFVGIVVNVLPRFVFDTIRRIYRPKDIDIIRERVSLGEFKAFPQGYDPTKDEDVEKYKDLVPETLEKIDYSVGGAHSRSSSSESYHKHSETSAVPNEEAPVHEKLSEKLAKPLGSIRRKLTISKNSEKAQGAENTHLTPLERMRANMIKNGEYVGTGASRTTSNVAGVTDATSLVSTHSRRQ